MWMKNKVPCKKIRNPSEAATRAPLENDHDTGCSTLPFLSISVMVRVEPEEDEADERRGARSLELTASLMIVWSKWK
jgi:hypothetical protein